MDRRNFIRGALAATAASFASASIAQGATGSSPIPPIAAQPGILNFNPNMRYRPQGLTGAMVSALGFGMLRLPMQADGKTVDENQVIPMVRYAIDHGLNYVDTAYVYLNGQSEAVTGKALRDGYRQKVYLTSKSPWVIMEKPEDFERCFAETLKRLQTDYLDFYHLHMLMHKGWKQKAITFGLVDKMMKLKEKGDIRYAGFSFHDKLPLFKEIVDYAPWDFCLVQHNYLDLEHEAGLDGIMYAAGKGMGVSIMEPLRNGFLVNPGPKIKAELDKAENKRSPVEWAFDYLWDKPEIGVVVSGMGNMQNVKDNLLYASRAEPDMLTPGDRKILGTASRIFHNAPGAVPCVGCDLCWPCPQNVAIGYIFDMAFDQYKANGNVERARRLIKNMPAVLRGVGPQACNDCGECLPRCPQAIQIPIELKRVQLELDL